MQKIGSRYRDRKNRLGFPILKKTGCRNIGLLLGVVLLIWLLYTLLHSLLTDHCRGYVYTRTLCEQYRLGNVAGSLCYDLCYENLPLLYRCVGDTEQFRLFDFNQTHTGKVLLRHLVAGSHDNQLSLDKVYGFPVEGSPLSEFNAALDQFLSDKLGAGEKHTERLRQIWRFADSNNDGKLSSAEAKSVWALLHINDFFIHLVFSDTPHVPKILGTCGDTYFLQKITETQLYRPLNEHFLIERAFPSISRWFWPYWPERVKLCLGLLEFTTEAYQHKADGAFYLCNLTLQNLGYTENYDPKFMDLSEVLSRQEVETRMLGRVCNADEDCDYSKQCVTKCDLLSRRCTGDLVRPSLYYLCRLIKPFLLPDAPRVIRGDLLHLFSRCNKLQGYMKDLALEHSLLYTDLRSLLWRMVSSTIY